MQLRGLFSEQCSLLSKVEDAAVAYLWDVTTGTKIWKKSYTEQLTAMDSDPFDPCRLACKKSISFY